MRVTMYVWPCEDGGVGHSFDVPEPVEPGFREDLSTILHICHGGWAPMARVDACVERARKTAARLERKYGIEVDLRLTPPPRVARLGALERVIAAAGGELVGTGGGHTGWAIARGDLHVLVTNDDGFVPAPGDEVLVGLYGDDEWAVPLDQEAFAWDAAAAGLADWLATLYP